MINTDHSLPTWVMAQSLNDMDHMAITQVFAPSNKPKAKKIIVSAAQPTIQTVDPATVAEIMQKLQLGGM